jgi:hypothetical protein
MYKKMPVDDTCAFSLRLQGIHRGESMLGRAGLKSLAILPTMV